MEIRPITDDEVEKFFAAILATFGGDVAADVDGPSRLRALIRSGRLWAAFDRGAIVATAGTFEQNVSTPGGGTLTVAGLTLVSVRPTHRRRGILRTLIDEHVAEARRRGEPASALWASEASIYGRFGYGCATESDEMTIDRRELELAIPPAFADSLDELHDLSDPDAAVLLPPLYERIRADRAGMMSRSEAWWTWRRFRERPDLRGGAAPRRYIAAWRDGEGVVGWMATRQKLRWDEGIPSGSYEIDELLALDTRAELTLWKLALSVDLYPTVSYWNTPVDTILPWLVSDRRRLRRRRTDALWLRPDDLDATLTSRRYSDDGVLRILVRDADRAIHELRVDGGAAHSTRVESTPDLHLDRATLGALLLGATPPSLLARAGLIEASPAALTRADRMFATSTPPWCAEIF